MAGEKLPRHNELGVSPREYLLAIADVVGELRRSFLHMSSEGAPLEEVRKILTTMEEIYESLDEITVPDSVVPLRRKVDAIRIVLDRTLSEYHFLIACKGKTDKGEAHGDG